MLSKSFLDPFGNEDSLSENFSVHCLICETNAGSVRWANGIEQLPFDDADLKHSDDDEVVRMT